MKREMKVYSGKDWKIYNGNMLDMLEVIEPESIDSIVTDPPYELNFMGKGWDNSGIAFQPETWERCYKVLKSGGYLLAFGGSRTFHRIAVAIEDAGFEIRDTIMWLYGSGFPKSLNIGKSVESKLVNGSANTQAFKDLKGTKETANTLGMIKRNADFGYKSRDYGADGHERTVEVDYQTEQGKRWNGWGTALKPAYEPVIVARKPCEGSCTDNVIKHGVGALNIDGCRIGDEKHFVNINDFSNQHGNKFGNGEPIAKKGEREVVGRFPSNTILTYDDSDYSDYQEVCGGFPYTASGGGELTHQDFSNHAGSMMHFSNLKEEPQRYENGYIAPKDKGSAARYFYCAKASKKDRDEGLEKRNGHPTVKPTTLMQYLVRLVTPEGGVHFRSF